MNRNQTEALVRLMEDIGFALSTMKHFASPTGTTAEVLENAIQRLECSHDAITEVFINEGEEA